MDGHNRDACACVHLHVRLFDAQLGTNDRSLRRPKEQTTAHKRKRIKRRCLRSKKPPHFCRPLTFSSHIFMYIRPSTHTYYSAYFTDHVLKILTRQACYSNSRLYVLNFCCSSLFHCLAKAPCFLCAVEGAFFCCCCFLSNSGHHFKFGGQAICFHLSAIAHKIALR